MRIFSSVIVSHIALSLFVLVVLASCAEEAEKNKSDTLPPNILWIVVEDISPMLGCYGDDYATTPHLDAFAAEAQVYQTAYSSSPICAPSRASFVTGVYATSQGAQHLRSEIPRTEILFTLSELLKQQGYFVSQYGKTDYNFSPEGIFDYWENDLNPWRQRPEGKPFFSMLHMGGTHEGSGNRREQYEKSVADLPDSLFHDPALVSVPPYYPDNEISRDLWARYHDLITAMDLRVGEVLATLKEDGLYDNTIVVFAADHGHGMARYKRWLNHTGLHIPLIIHVPEHLQSEAYKAGSTSNRLVSLVDLPASMLNLLGLPIAGYMQGQPFLGKNLPEPKQYLFNTRDRADNMYEVSRAIRDERFLYVRHYLPHLPHMQPGFIYSDVKEGFKLLHEAYADGSLPEAGKVMYRPKGNEELYDLLADPQELNNLAQDPDFTTVKDRLKAELHQRILATRDAGLLLEAEMMLRSEGSTPYLMAQDPTRYDLPKILEAAEMVGTATASELADALKSPDSGVRTWALIGIQALGDEGRQQVPALTEALSDASPSVQIVAAETLCRLGICEEALPILARHLLDDRPWLALQAARSLELLEEKAKPVLPQLRQALEKYKAAPGSKSRYADYNFAAFISWSVKYALHHCGDEIDISW